MANDRIKGIFVSTQMIIMWCGGCGMVAGFGTLQNGLLECPKILP